MVHLAIFVSGNGTNCENIIRYFSDPAKEVSVDIVVSNKPDAYALTRARRLGVKTAVISAKQFREDPALVLGTVKGCDYIILAGFLVLVPEYLIDKFPDRIVNIHPALLPKFGGKGMWGHHVHEAVKAAGEKETGITIHYVNSEYDSGKIIAQFRTALSPQDSVEDIEAKIHVLEQAHYPQVIEQVINNNR